MQGSGYSTPLHFSIKHPEVQVALCQQEIYLQTYSSLTFILRQQLTDWFERLRTLFVAVLSEMKR